MTTAVAAGQNAYNVFRGSVHEYSIAKTEFAYSYSWQIYTDLSFTSEAGSSQAELTPLGPGRENEIQVKWNSAGDYYLMVTVSTAEGCANRKAWHFIVDPIDDKPTARIVGAPLPVLGSCDQTGLVLDASTSTGDGLAYSWFPTNFLDNASSSKPVFHPGTTMRYVLTVIDTRSQTDTTSILVKVADPPKAVTDNYVFINSTGGTILLNGISSTGVGLTYQWTSPDGTIIDGQTSAAATVSGIGKYYLTVTDQYGCSDLDSVLVNYYTQAVIDTGTTQINFSVDINVLRNDIPRKDLDPASLKIVTPPQNGLAVVIADSVISYTPSQYFVGTDNFVYSVCDYFNNCDQASVLVIVNDQPFFIPDAFSPNGDGLNDVFEIKGLAKYQRVQLTVFNRWGNAVYESNNYGAGPGKDGFWDGKARAGLKIGSGPVPTGTYFYVLKLDGKEKINGSLYLDR